VNALASQFWEGQLHAALKDSPARFLFENTGSTFYDKGFKMLQVLEDNFRPSSISNTFTTLLSLFNDKQSDKEGIMSFVPASRDIFQPSLVRRWPSLRFSKS